MGARFDELVAEVGEFTIPPSESIVLLVDDEQTILATLERFLLRKGYVVLTADSTEEALDVLATDYLPHVVLTDKNLPEKDGLALIREGRQLSPTTEFILMTGYATIESCIEALELGAAGYIQKPFDLKKVLAQIEAALNKNVAQRRNDMLVDKLRLVCEQQATVGRERNMLRDFVDTQVRNLIADLTSQLGSAEASLHAIAELHKAIHLVDTDAKNAEKSLQEALRGVQQALTTVSTFMKNHQGLTK